MSRRNRETYLNAKETEAKLDLVELSKAGGFLGGGNADAASERSRLLSEEASNGYQGTMPGRWGNRLLLLFLVGMGVFLLARLIFEYM